ncbi:MAG TPA: ABC-F family ATP-binding cassette domain-containing protein [Pseudogracilibacillus sp.]|nr:ABC-F family ATP-binding cassette domain-containing protein [Pseudogracilibacillus sp.]
MIVMQLKNIYKSFAGIPALEDINITVQDKDRIAIVGRNGAGKSTLLKILTTEYSYDEGEFFQAKNIHIGYLAQHNDLQSDLSIYDEMLTIFAHLQKEEEELLQLSIEIEELATKGETDFELIHSYSRRQEAFEEEGGYRYKSDIKGVLIGLGFSEEMFSLKVNDLSGGQKTRLALAKLLLQAPEVLILDEPTNHLDIDTLTWLENYLLNYKGAIVLVSHDRYFLDKLVNIVYEITYKKSFRYVGTYTQYLEQKAGNIERYQKQYEKQQEEIKRMEEFVDRNIARASTSKRAQSVRKQLEKIDRLETPLGYEAEAKFSFNIKRASGNDVLNVDHLTFLHDGQAEPLFTDVSFHLYKGERIALIGENGVGKTTLLEAIVKGHSHIHLGANVTIGYYDQEQKDLTASNTVLEELWSDYPLMDEQKIRTILGNFLFSGDDVFKHIHTLSGGEKARLSLAKLMLKEANLLILDEPTNHLDLTSKELLEDALLHYPGTILFVSHDRYFINKISDKVVELTRQGATEYLGNYDYFIEKRQEMIEREKLEKQDRDLVNPVQTNKEQLSYEEQKQKQREERKQQREIESIEADIEAIEMSIATLEEELNDEAVQTDYEKMYELTSQIETKQAKMEELLEKWEALH